MEQNVNHHDEDWTAAENMAELGQSLDEKEAEQRLRADHPASQDGSSPRVVTDPSELAPADAYSDLGGGVPSRGQTSETQPGPVDLSRLSREQHNAAMAELREIRRRLLHSDTRDEATNQLNEWERRYRQR